ncbi:sigma-70 family RNA polymerase sigma factor [Sporosarcina sp. A2]|uniref:sigma-70 family RNA polymerase sigma factor n=1 Tax=Sporosarcina sp. A2 TaxID=3393449 RepID=UPI003D7B1E66
MGDYELAKQASQGNEDAFLALMHVHKVALYRTALSYLKNNPDAIQAVQEVTVRAFQTIHTLRKPEYAKTWMIRIMMNYCNDVLKMRRRITLDEEVLGRTAISDDYTFLEVDEALDRLSEEERDLIHLKYLHDIKLKDIAAMTSTPEGTVKTRLYKTVKKLRKLIEVKGGRHNE